MSWIDEINKEAEEVYLLGQQNPGVCEFCARSVEHIFVIPSQTSYIDEERNADKEVCLDCAIGYTEDIEERWRDYYRDRL